MSNSNKNANLKEKLKQALISTFKVISDDFKVNDGLEKNKNSTKLDFLELDNLNNKSDFIKARADSDSTALKKKFSNSEIYKKNLPSNTNCKSLYSITEKIRYESLGGNMLKGIQKNFIENYNQMINLKKKDQLQTKEDVTVNEAFELYMLKKFHNIKLNQLSNKMLSFWESEFDQSIAKHIPFLKDNLEDQNKYSSKFSQIFQEMDIFQSEDNEENNKENKDDGQNNPSNDENDSDSEDNKDQNKEDETVTSIDADYDIDEYKLDEELVDSDSDKQSNEQVVQKKSLNASDLEYKIFTSQFDEVTKAENLDNADEASKLRKTLDQQLVSFQDIITKLATNYKGNY